MAEWRKIDGFSRYSVSDDGRVRNDKSGRILSPETINWGYKRVCLCKDGEMHHRLVARLVADAFLPEHDADAQINHIDEDKSNNSVSNLEWVTASQNINHGTRNERMATKHRRPVVSIDVKTGQRTHYSGVRIAAKKVGVSSSQITGVCRKLAGYKTAAGLLWEYADAEVK